MLGSIVRKLGGWLIKKECGNLRDEVKKVTLLAGDQDDVAIYRR